MFNPIIRSFLDNDWYQFTMGQLVFHKFPMARARYTFINRNHTKFPFGFCQELKAQINCMQKLALSSSESDWLSKFPYLKPDYINFLLQYKFNPSEVEVFENDNELEIYIDGQWCRSILWQIPLLSIVSELYYKILKFKPLNDWHHIQEKAIKLEKAGVNYIDFGTRRRFSYSQQRIVNITMSDYKTFLGTSNPHFAKMYELNPIGTYAHELPMAMSVGFGGTKFANYFTLYNWVNEYQDYLKIALSDTYTTDVFLKEAFNGHFAKEFDGIRQDSGNPFKFTDKVIAHYHKLNIDPLTKMIVFSDSLDVNKAVELNEYCKGKIRCQFGIGTNLTNDCGYTPLNIVIKLSQINFGNGWIDVVKLSDDVGKNTGKVGAVKRAKEDLGV